MVKGSPEYQRSQIHHVLRILGIDAIEITPRIEISMLDRKQLPYPTQPYWVHQALVYDSIAFPAEAILAAYHNMVEAGIAKPGLEKEDALREVLKFRAMGAKRLDAIIYTATETIVIEAKTAPDLANVDQLMGYIESLRRDLLRPWARDAPLRLILTIPETSPALTRMMQAKGIEYIQSPPLG